MATSSRSSSRSKAPAKKRAGARSSVWARHRFDFLLLLSFVAGALMLLSDFGAMGVVGDKINLAVGGVVGIGRFVLPFFLMVIPVLRLIQKAALELARLTFGLPMGFIALTSFAQLANSSTTWSAPARKLGDAGGYLGLLVGQTLKSLTGTAGALVILGALTMVSVMIVTGWGLLEILRVIGGVFILVGRLFARWWSSRPERPERVDDEPAIRPSRRRPAPPREEFVYDEPDELPEVVEHEPIRFDEPDIDLDDDVTPAPAPAKKKATPTPKPPVAALVSESHWVLPDSKILQRTKEHKLDRAAVDAAGDELVAALAAHGVETTLVGYTVGPTVTRFELELGAGVKVARVTSLNRDIAYAMASPDVRILAPIPGRSAIGVEVPNRQRQLVALGDLLASDEALEAQHPLDVPLGRDISGQTVVVNLAEMPHVLISGATGAGKSSCINGLITSLVMRATPDNLKLILVDPKRVELGQYNDLPHLLSPVVVDPKKAAGALAWAVKEMERRYDILAQYGVRDLTSYQQMVAAGKITVEPTSEERSAELVEDVTGVVIERPAQAGPELLPYIVIVVDELNDLMMVAARDVEESVVRIAQMARAVGIHLVLATQRPSVDVITGVIKANIPSRMAFAVSSLADSRVILDQAGAERLIGKGDMLLLTASSNIARRLQSPWVSEEEVRNVVMAWTAQGGRPEPVVASDITDTKPLSLGSSGDGGDEDDDEVLRLARELVVRTQSGSVSMLQRKLRVGFARAGRIMDMLENEGTVGPGEGSKSRKVLMTLDEWERQQADD